MTRIDGANLLERRLKDAGIAGDYSPHSFRATGHHEFSGENEPQTYHNFMTVKAVVHTAEEGGFWAEVPALPGCVTQAETMEELRVNLEDAIKLWFEAGESEMMTTEG